MSRYLAPGLYWETPAPAPAIDALRTDVAAFVGIAERGPLDQPTLIDSWQQFASRFGGFLANGLLACAVKAFFENGGRRCWVVRVAAPEATAAEPAGATRPADRGWSTTDATAGFAAGAAVTVSQAGGASVECLLREVDATAPGGPSLVWERPLPPELRLGPGDPPLRYATGAVAASTTVPDDSGRATLELRASSPGAWGNDLSVRVERSTGARADTAGRTQPPQADVLLVDTVMGFAAGSLVRVLQPGVPPAYGIVARADSRARRIEFRNPLPAAFVRTTPIELETLSFALSVYARGDLRELIADVSLDPEHERYVERAAAASRHLRAKVLPLAGPLQDRLPARRGPDAGARYSLRGGRDGIAALRPEHFTGRASSTGATGLAAFATVDEPAIVAIPDALIEPRPARQRVGPPPPPDPCLPGAPAPLEAPPSEPAIVERTPSLSLEDVARVQQALVEHCEALRDRVALLDAPRARPAGSDADLALVQAWRQRFDSSYAALYFPWGLAPDPLRLDGSAVRPVPPSGWIAGACARVDNETGVHQAPANLALRWIEGVTVAVGQPLQEVLNPLGVNCVRALPGRGIRPYGARTVSSDPAWRYLSVRRLLLMIEEALEESLAWAAFEPNDFQVREAISLTVSMFLNAQWARGALAGRAPEEAFFVKCDDEVNPQDSVDAGELRALVGVAPSVPAEFVVVRIGRTDAGFEAVES